MRFIAGFIIVTSVHMTVMNTCSLVTAQELQQPSRKEPSSPDDVTVLRDVVFGTGGGRDLKMHIVLPKDKSDIPMPAYVWVHGGGWQGGTKEGGVRQVLPLVREGFVGATIEYRLTGEAPFPAQIEDCKCAIRYLRSHAKQYNLDPGRIAVGGSSAGGHLVALLGTSGDVKELEGTGGWADQSSEVQAVVDLYGPTDFKAFVTTVGYEGHNKDGSPESKLLGGGEVLSNEAGIKRVNPITYVDRADPPFLIVHGTDDRTVPLNQSEAIHEALKSVDVESALHVINGAGHGGPEFAQPDIRNLQRAFLIKTLLPTSFRFRHHFVDRDLPGGSWGQTALVDIDRDGDLDFITGQKAGNIRWYEFDSECKSWSLHLLGRDSPSDVGGLAMDVNRDGRLDFVAGGAWYRQPEQVTAEPWTRFVFDKQLNAVHDIIAADLDGNGHDEVITMSDKNDVRYYRVPTDDATEPWTPKRISDPVHAGLAAGDIDGDGDIDLVRSQIWLENVGGGTTWKEHAFCGIPWANRKEQAFYYLASRSWIADINRDGRQDIVLTENEIPGGRIAWFEAPEDPKQTNWQPHFLKASDSEARGPYHSLQLADFDNDGDTDIFAGEMEALAVAPHRWFIWENVNGDGSQFVERVILNKQLGTHETQAGDVDGDGDIDLVGKLWRPVPDNGNRGRNHVDFLENLTTK